MNASFSESLYKTIEYDFAKDQFLPGLASLKDAALNSTSGNGITRENFTNGTIQHNYKINLFHKDKHYMTCTYNYVVFYRQHSDWI